MHKSTWRDEWSVFRVNLVTETARCLADQQSRLTHGQRPRWETLTNKEQIDLVENIAGIFVAQDQALHHLLAAGEGGI